MKKLFHPIFLLPLIAVPSVGIFSILFFNTCSSVNNDSPQEIKDFIYNRSFSIYCKKQSSDDAGWVGTGWLFKHIENYKYYMFTNWHVSLNSGWYGISYATSSNDDSLVSFPMYASSSLPIPQWSSADYFSTGTKKYGVDTSLIEINLSHMTGLYSRLDALNAYADSHNGLLFNGIRRMNDIDNGTTFYMGGYPFKTWAGTGDNSVPWFQTGSDVIASKEDNFSSMTHSHDIDDDTKNIVSISNNYLASYSAMGSGPLFNLGGGASGSMMIDAGYNLLGIYWGGSIWGSSAYQPHFEVFSWDEHNLFDDYINGDWIPTTPPSKNNNTFMYITIGVVGITIIGISIFAIFKKSNSRTKIKSR